MSYNLNTDFDVVLLHADAMYEALLRHCQEHKLNPLDAAAAAALVIRRLLALVPPAELYPQRLQAIARMVDHIPKVEPKRAQEYN